MKKNLIIGVLSLVSTSLLLYGFVQKTQAEHAKKAAIECEIRVQEQMAIAEEQRQMAQVAQQRAELALVEAMRSAEKARELATTKE